MGVKVEDPDTIDFKRSDIALLESEAFCQTGTVFYACNTGTNDNSGTSFAQEWANLTNGPTMAIQNGRSDYSLINHAGMNSESNIALSFPKLKFAVSVTNVFEKGKEIINEQLGWEVFQLSDEWYDKMERKEERQSTINGRTKGYADKGSLSYPVLASLIADMDVISDIEFWLEHKERGWKLFESQENHEENTD